MSVLPSDWGAMERAANAAGWCLSYESYSGGPWRCVAWPVVPMDKKAKLYQRNPDDRLPPREIGDFAAARAWLAEGCPDRRPGYVLNQIATGDARELAASIPDGSVDLVFTDPVYQNIEDYTWLAETAMRVLKPRGVLLAWTSVPKLGRAQQAMEDAGAQYVYTLFYTVVAKTHRMRWYNLFCWTTPCLWFQRPGEATKPRKWMPDTYQETMLIPRWRWLARMLQRTLRGNTVISQSAPTGGFGWNKNTGVLVKWIEAFCPPGGVVYDPFTGTGSVPIACTMTGRQFYAGELLPERADEARARLSATPAPMLLRTERHERHALMLEDAA